MADRDVGDNFLNVVLEKELCSNSVVDITYLC